MIIKPLNLVDGHGQNMSLCMKEIQGGLPVTQMEMLRKDKSCNPNSFANIIELGY